jgi:ABC-type multidrug transport system ATPase subunit
VATGTRQTLPAGIGVEFQNVEKRYGMRFALRGVSLRIVPGEAMGLVGDNGSGKTTLLRMAARLIRPTSGNIEFSSRNGHGISLVAHHTLLYDDLTAEENLMLFAQLYALESPRQRIAEAIESAGLGGRGADLVRGFSRGMRQRLTIARALLPRPGLLLLDEPATGLDAAGQQWLGQTLARLRSEGCTLMMSTHGRSEAHTVLTRAVRLDVGRVIADSAVSGDFQSVLATALTESEEG